MSKLHASEKTHQGVLPQPPALEPAPADNREGKDETGCGRRPQGLTTGVQHGRGETRSGPSTSGHAAGQPAGGRHRRRQDEPGGTEPGGRKPSIAAPKPVTPRVFVLGRDGKPLYPCHPARARRLLASGRAKVARHTPFVIRLIDRRAEHSQPRLLEVKIDPGSRHSGVALVSTDAKGHLHGLFSVQVDHRGQLISKHLRQRSGYRRRRRSSNLRYRAPRSSNRGPASCDCCGANAQHGRDFCRPCQAAGKPRTGARGTRLAPSLQHRVDGTMSVLARLCRWAPVGAVSVVLARFDTQALQGPGISGTGYQQGTLAGYEVREYLLEKWGRRCAYCGAKGTGPGPVPLNIDHVRPRSKGGSNRVSNLVVACVPCNEAKDDRPVEEFLAGKPEVLKRVLAQLKAPLGDVAAVNSTRWALRRALVATGLPVSTSTGGRTKWNRTRLGLPKTHTLDALCVGEVGAVSCYPSTVTVALATGRGSYARTTPDKYGFPRLARPRAKAVHGFATGDLVRAVVPTGKKAGAYVGRVAVRSSGSFNISTTTAGTVQGINHRHCRLLQRSDGWGWSSQREGELNAA